MGIRRVLLAALLIASGVACSDSGSELGRDDRGRVLTGTVLDLGDELAYAEPLVIIGETPWGTIHACPEDDPAVEWISDEAVLVDDTPLPSDGEVIAAVWQRLVRFDGEGARTADPFVVPAEDLTIDGTVVAASWIPDTAEPIAAWFALADTRIIGYVGCDSWFNAPG